jgi:uncharacterized DUF497 family protein
MAVKHFPAMRAMATKSSSVLAVRRTLAASCVGEQRVIGVGLLDYLVVLIVHVETDETIRIISMRNADDNETDIYYQNVGHF